MSKQASLERVRETLVKLKEDIDTAEDRLVESKAANADAVTR